MVDDVVDVLLRFGSLLLLIWFGLVLHFIVDLLVKFFLVIWRFVSMVDDVLL